MYTVMNIMFASWPQFFTDIIIASSETNFVSNGDFRNDLGNRLSYKNLSVKL